MELRVGHSYLFIQPFELYYNSVYILLYYIIHYFNIPSTLSNPKNL